MRASKTYIPLLVVALVAYLVLFHTNFVINRSRDFKTWGRDFNTILEGGEPPSGLLMNIEYGDELRRDYVRCLTSARSDLALGIGGEATMKTRSDKLAWQVDDVLCITNLGPLLGMPADFEPNLWRKDLGAFIDARFKDIDSDRFPFIAFAALHYDEVSFVNTYGGHALRTEERIDIRGLRKAQRGK